MKCPMCGYKMKFAGELDQHTDLFLCKNRDCSKEIPVSKSYRNISEFTLVYGYDADGEKWEGIYINGVLVDENHSLTAREVMRLFARNGYSAEEYEITDKRFWKNNSNLPNKFADLPNKILE